MSPLPLPISGLYYSCRVPVSFYTIPHLLYYFFYPRRILYPLYLCVTCTLYPIFSNVVVV